ncbi:MAG: hypothetical protein EPO11_02890 [Gammaproteobacteria bacterium]|nr:MAG: hypothetical protein EPO11_02890 [Gammaproteobacteria bacterium]
MIAPRQDIARLQSDFYRIQFHRLLRWLMVSFFLMFLLIAAVIYLVLNHPAPEYYANTTEGRILAMPPAQ